MNLEEKNIILDKLSINYVEAGCGAPILFLHNGSGFWQSWQHQISHFALTHKVYSFDWPGCGKSEYPGRPLDLTIISNILELFVKEKQLEKFHLIGNCIGGSAALAYSIKNPAAINKLIIFNICPGDLLLPKLISKRYVKSLETRASARRRTERLLKIAFPNLVVQRMFPKMLFGKSIKKSDSLFQKYRTKQKEKNQRQTRIDQFFSAHSFNLLPIIENKKLPEHLLIWGEENRVANLHKHGLWHRKKLNSNEFHVIKKAGHLCMYEAPIEVNKIIETYLNSN